MRHLLLSVTILLVALTSVSLWITKDGMLAKGMGDLAPSAGNPAIGGAFTLIDQNGKTVSDADFRGKIMLVFFGFTNCPDICPVTTKNLSDTMVLLGNKADQVAPIFISVDPKRDTPEVMKTYFSNFDSRIVGLTGSDEQVKQAAAAYKAYYAKSKRSEEDERGAHGAHSGAGDYQVDHSGYIYLMDREGNYVQHFSYNESPESLAAAVKPHLK